MILAAVIIFSVAAILCTAALSASLDAVAKALMEVSRANTQAYHLERLSACINALRETINSAVRQRRF